VTNSSRRQADSQDQLLVRSVARAGKILEALLTSPDGLRLVEVAERAGLHKTTALRLLRTLTAIGVVRRTEQGDRYTWDGVRWLAVALRLRDAASRVDAVQTILGELAADAGETVGLAYPDINGRDMLCVAATVPNTPVRVDPGGRSQWPLHATASGKMYLACQSEAEQQAWIGDGLPALTERTITSRDELLAELAAARDRGYAVTRGEAIVDAGAIAIPVRDERGDVAACLQLTSPVQRMTKESIQRWLPLMRDAAHRLSELLYLESGADSRTGPGDVTSGPDEAASSVSEGDSTDGDAGQRYRLI
jgi:DNA-binding IclR family transcriptional regulator